MATPASFPLFTRAGASPGFGVSEAVDVVVQKWRLTREGLDKFLSCLDPDREKAGRKYELLRSKLISYFDWRDCPFPEDHADEALNRVIRKIDIGEEIRDASTYVFGIARMMLLEIARTNEKERAALDRLPTTQVVDTESEEVGRRIDCLRQCLQALPERSRELISHYYHAEGAAKIKQRKELAARLGLELNALRIRAFRLREKLEECMGRCLASKQMFPSAGSQRQR